MVDPAPIEPTPPGLTAWKIELSPDLAPGNHEIHVSTFDANGVQSADAPVIHFRVVTGVIRIGSTLISVQLIAIALLIVSLVLFGLMVLFLVLWLRQRQRRSVVGVVRPDRNSPVSRRDRPGPT